MKLTTTFASLLALTLVAGPAIAQSPAKELKIPESAKPMAELAAFQFLEGQWTTVNLGGGVNEEDWMPARGNHMLATFRQVRRDGKPALVEVSLLSVEKEGIRLRTRHLHGELDVPANRPNASDFEVVKTGRNWAEFRGVGEAKAVISVKYQLVDANTLRVTTTFDPATKERPFTLTYTRRTS